MTSTTMPFVVLLVAGTLTASLAALLLFLRFEKVSRRALAWARRVPRAAPQKIFLLVAPLAGASALCFAALQQSGPQDAPANLQAAATATVESDDRRDEALASLRAYADRVAKKREAIDNISLAGDETQTAKPDNLPDVETMIARLASRLEQDPNDAKGWKMLGWSYLNTNRPADAVKAYETALKLAPGDAEVKQALETAKSGGKAPDQAADTTAPPPPPAGAEKRDPSPDQIKAASNLPEDQQGAMIRGMVERLASRLETSPRDEEGWVRLMRARMVLGEKDAAKTAYSKALETFADDAGAKDRLAASARELGMENN